MWSKKHGLALGQQVLATIVSKCTPECSVEWKEEGEGWDSVFFSFWFVCSVCGWEGVCVCMHMYVCLFPCHLLWNLQKLKASLTEANSLQHVSKETDISPYIILHYLSSLEHSNILKYIFWTYTGQDGCTLVPTWIYTLEVPQLSVFSVWVRREKTWMSGPFLLLTVQEKRRMWMEPMTLTLRLQHPYLSHFLLFFSSFSYSNSIRSEELIFLRIESFV